MILLIKTYITASISHGYLCRKRLKREQGSNLYSGKNVTSHTHSNIFFSTGFPIGPLT